MPKLDDWEKIVRKSRKDPLRAKSIMILPIIVKKDIKLLEKSKHVDKEKKIKKAMKKLKKIEKYLKSKFLVRKYHADSHKDILKKSKKLFKLYKDLVKNTPKGIHLNLSKYMKHFERNLKHFLNEISRLNRRYKHIYEDSLRYCARNGLSIKKKPPELMYLFRDPSTRRSVSIAAFYNRKKETITLLGIGMLTSQKYIDILLSHEIFYDIENSIGEVLPGFYSKIYSNSDRDVKSAVKGFKKSSRNYANILKKRKEDLPEKQELISLHQEQIEVAEKRMRKMQKISSKLINDIAKEVGKSSFKDIMNELNSVIGKESKALTHYRDQIYKTAQSIDNSLYNSSRRMYHFENNIGDLWRDDYKTIRNKLFKLAANKILKDFGKKHFRNFADYLAYGFTHDVLGASRRKSIHVLKAAADSKRHEKKRMKLMKSKKALKEVRFTMDLMSTTIRSGIIKF